MGLGSSWGRRALSKVFREGFPQLVTGEGFPGGGHGAHEGSPASRSGGGLTLLAGERSVPLQGCFQAEVGCESPQRVQRVP